MFKGEITMNLDTELEKILLGVLDRKDLAIEYKESLKSLLREWIEGKKTDVPDKNAYSQTVNSIGVLTSLNEMGPYRSYNQALDDLLQDIGKGEK